LKAIKPITRARIKAHLETFIERVVGGYKQKPIPTLGSPSKYLSQVSVKGQLKPFHAAIIPPTLMRISEFERGFSTSLGTSFEECARLIALDHHRDAQRSFDITGAVSGTALGEIERQVALFERTADVKAPRPTLEGMVESVLAARDEGETQTRVARADLYVLAKDRTRYFFEMKSPMPNKGQCLEVTQRLLRIHLLTGKSRPDVQAFFAMAYNPYGPMRAQYKWSMTPKYTPFDQAVVIGQEFWTLIGGPTTYAELLSVYQEVGRDKSKYMLDALAFGF
jgi:hypothetical protein